MPTPPDPCWLVDVAITAGVALDPAEPSPRDEFVALLWELLDGTGLAGIHEGTVDAEEAFTSGIVASPLVLDTAAGDPRRDWVGAMDRTTATLWFGDQRGARDAAAILAGVSGCEVLGVRREESRDWERESRAGHGPIVIPGFGTIVPPWDNDSGDPRSGTTVVIDPGPGFGTGLHPTTRLCLAAVAAGPSVPDRVLDYGAGSGILGIAAALRGARAVDAVEIDPRVHEAIRRNGDLNGVAGRLAVSTHPPPNDTGAPYGLVLANIVAPVLLEHAAELVARVAPGGRLVLSGVRAEDVAAVVDRYRHHLHGAPVITDLDGWYCLVFERD